MYIQRPIGGFAKLFCIERGVGGKVFSLWGIGGYLDHGEAPDLEVALIPPVTKRGWWAVRRLVNREVRHPAHSKVPRAQPTAKHTDKSVAMLRLARMRLTLDR
ncbi:hypothetical protein N005_08070 [Pseudomonas mediterranea CFBP 5447]|nr:hypothetical protein N005_08070 [Pseudomonas mediterranea CFBP 5447]